jgi:glutamate dehydrogenase
MSSSSAVTPQSATVADATPGLSLSDPHFAAFLAQFGAHVPPDDRKDLSDDSLRRMAYSLWELAQQRTSGTATVRLLRLDPAPGEAAFPQTVIEAINDDMPFLVRSLVAEVNRRDMAVNLVIHPVLQVVRDGAGRVQGLANGEGTSTSALTPQPESFIHIRLPALPGGASEEADLTARVQSILADVRATNQDWLAMRAMADTAAQAIAGGLPPVSEGVREESAALLHWLGQDNFTFIGYRELRYSEPSGEDGLITVVPASGLGILRDETRRVFATPRHTGALPDDIRLFLEEPRLVHFSKADEASTVHRSAPLDVISVKFYDDSGVLAGEHRFVGLFTSQVFHLSPRHIPVLRHKIIAVLARAGFDPQGHDGKALLHILETFPRDELWLIGEAELLRISLGILNLQERQRTALFMRRDPFGRYVSCFVFVPRDRYTLTLRSHIQAILEHALQGSTRTLHAAVEESALARLYFVIATDPARSDLPATASIEAALVEASRSWDDKIRLAFLRDGGGAAAMQLVDQFAGAFPVSYQETYDVAEAQDDIRTLAALYTDEQLKVRLRRRDTDLPHLFRVKLFALDNPLPLSDILPVLENMGLRVISELPFEISTRQSTTPAWLHEFEIATRNRQPVNLAAVAESFGEALLNIWCKRAEDDTFNRLVLLAGLTWQQAALLRALARYLKQATFPFEQDRIAEALATEPALAMLFCRYFTLKFDPAQDTGRNETVAACVTAISEALTHIDSVTDDRILNALWTVLQAIVRTNAFQPTADDQPKPYVSFKLDSGAIPFLPLPRPFREVFVYSPDMEAIHLRGAKVARGGIRWSDRKDDYRTEVLGLLKAQMVKNAVIVPGGSKGGFIVKRPPADDTPEARRQDSIGAYQTMMRGLLDITDTIVRGQIVPPQQVVRHDGDDPYLVVAADKGTATFSDIANGIALEYGFWLGDAFASGGSVGYDHKKMGITARGGWEAVKRHFRELGKDIQAEPFTVVGIGDMSGDVFGNGMLLSRQIKLRGAFNHQHIFIDPDPDPATSFAERERLFNLPRSGWTDYDTSKLSAGGGIYDRGAKSIPLSTEARAWLGVTTAHPTPAEIIQALLRTEVDLLWFGGIGTYVRASGESNTDAGDKANDSIRVTGADLRARVIGEGANLGLTQRARIEYALAGGRLNTDAIDNSAGVDCSDHEVNIKILFQQVMEDTGLSLTERDRLLVTMTDAVAHLVLRDNYLQTQAISFAEAQGTALLHPQAELIRRLEARGKLNRALEFLPSDSEIEARFQQGRGLTRPELAVVLAYAKMDLADQLIETTLPDEERLLEDLHLYFPAPLRIAYGTHINAHPLKREIIVTHASNSIVNRMGPHFAHELQQVSGLPMSDVLRAYSIARQAFDLRTVWAGIEDLDARVAASVQQDLLYQVSRLLGRATLWFIRHGAHPLNVMAQVERFRPQIMALEQVLPTVMTEAGRTAWEERVSGFITAGVPEDLARRVAASRPMAAACDIARVAHDRGHSVTEAARVYFALGEVLHIDWLREAARGIRIGSAWQQQALDAIVGDLRDCQREGAMRVLVGGQNHRPCGADTLLAAWQEQAALPLRNLDGLVQDLRRAPQLDLAMLLVATRMLKGVLTQN